MKSARAVPMWGIAFDDGVEALPRLAGCVASFGAFGQWTDIRQVASPSESRCEIMTNGWRLCGFARNDTAPGACLVSRNKDRQEPRLSKDMSKSIFRHNLKENG